MKAALAAWGGLIWLGVAVVCPARVTGAGAPGREWESADPTVFEEELRGAVQRRLADTAFSSSGQFIVHGTGGTPAIVGPGLVVLPNTTNAASALVGLDRDLLAASAERVKRALLRELGMADRWRGRIYLQLRPVDAGEGGIGLAAAHFPGGWQYELVIPGRVGAEPLTRALVEVLLLEMANRGAADRSAEIPLWLSEGLARELSGSVEANLVLRPNARLVRQWVRPDPLLGVQQYLRTNQALTFKELSLPRRAQLVGVGWTNFQACAQLLVHDLLALPDGRVRLAEFVGSLSAYLNWQTAFLRTFHPCFERWLDVEKWWAIHVVDFTGYDRHQAWSQARTLRALDSILRLPIEVRQATNVLPAATNLSLQNIIGQWDFAHQRNVLLGKAQLLAALRMTSAPELQPLVDAYRLALLRYLQKCEASGGSSSWRRWPGIRPAVLRAEAIRQLGACDARREEFERRLEPDAGSGQNAATSGGARPSPATP